MVQAARSAQRSKEVVYVQEAVPGGLQTREAVRRFRAGSRFQGAAAEAVRSKRK